MKKQALILSTAIFLYLSGSYTYALSESNLQNKESSFPVKYICESLGGKISWNQEKREATVKYRNKTLILKIGSKTITSNGSEKVMDSKVKIMGGRTVLPISVLNNELGINLTEQDCLNIIGNRFISLVKSGSTKEASALLSKTFSNYLTANSMEELSESIRQLQLQDKNLQYWEDSVHRTIAIPVTNRTNTYYTVKFNYDGKIDELGIQIKRAEAAPEPDYSAPDSFTETDVVFGDGAWKLPGTLTMPVGKGPFPAVILIHDDGAGDRDGTTGLLKPLRDLAHGLASNNIAVFRYDKRTLVHNTKLKLIGNVTLNEEVEQDVYNAAEYLKSVAGINDKRIITLGYGLGGYALPEIMTTGSETFKAGVIMSGISRPQYEMFPDYFEYLQKKGLASEEQVEYVKGQVNFLSSPGFNPQNPPDGYTMGRNYYYSYMKSNNVLDIVADLNKPLLVMQGQRDYLVRADIDFTNWKKALNRNNQAEFKLYPKLNHLYTEGEGDSTPEEYYRKNNVPKYVIQDIADFINKLE